jgi:hypothetical protein
MNRAKLAAAVSAFTLALAAPGWAAPATWLADCTTGGATSGEILKNGTLVVSGLLPTNTLGFSLLGTPSGGPGQISPGPVAGDIIEIKGICTEDVTVSTPGLTLANDSNSGALITTDGVLGQLELAGVPNTVINGILIGTTAGASAFGGSESANLYLHDGAALTLENSQVSNGPLIGILATRSSAVSVIATTVSNNGSLAGGNDNTNMGILASDNATVYLGERNGTGATTIENNSGAGIEADEASSVVIYAATISGNTLPQVELLGASSGLITGLNGSTTQITAPSGGGSQAIFATGASTLDVEQGAVVAGNENNAAIGLNASTLLLQGSVVSSGAGGASPSTAEPTLHGTGNSVIALAGGNTICFGTVSAGPSCAATSGGTAIGVDHVSTLAQTAAATLGYAAATDSVFGGGLVQMQSTADLGLGLISGAPSLTWATGTRGVTIRQNSSFRLQGGATVTGAITLTQSSNAFFNKSNGGTNTVSGGMLCPFGTVPAAYIAGPANVSPAPVLASSIQSAEPNQCLPF